MAKAEEIACKIVANGPHAVRAIKQGVTRTSGLSLEEGFKIENELAQGVFSSADASEVHALLSKGASPGFRAGEPGAATAIIGLPEYV